MGRAAFAVSTTMVLALAVGCGGRTGRAAPGANGSAQVAAGATAGASEGGSTGSSAAASTGYGTPQDCVAAGGQCVLAGGGGLLCTTEGPANTCNCNPGCDPGGAICCIAFVDGGTQPEGGQPVDGGTATADFVGTWSCPVDDAGDALSFTVIANGADLTETFSVPLMGGGGNLTCAEQFTVSGSTATLIPSLTSCMVPQGVDLEGVPAYGSQTVSGNTLTYAEEDEGGPLQTVSCTRQ